MTEVPDCPRCGEPTEQDFDEIHDWSSLKPIARVPTSLPYCPTDGCVDEHSSNVVESPPTAAEMRRQADDLWLGRQRSIATEVHP